MKTILVFLLLATAVYAQKFNGAATGKLDATNLNLIPPSTTFASPPASPPTNAVYLFSDASSAGVCTGGGSSKAQCQWSGSVWVAVGGGGGSGPTAGTPDLSGGGSTTFTRAIGCAKGSVALSGGTITYPGGTVAQAASSSQEITIITGLNGNVRYDHTMLSEHTIFASSTVTAIKASLGRPGSTNDELLPQMSMMVSSGDASFIQDRPQPPVIGAANTYTIVLALRTTGGLVSDITTGQVNFEVCAYAVQ